MTNQGTLHVFLGMCAGVGKTFNMLRFAHEKKREGLDVVVGFVETHKRKDTQALVEGLESVPLKKVNYKETTFFEMDVDAILARRPRLVIVDELAHTNAPGSRHKKRYQDVEELLQAGINVLTAMNIQHMESRKEAVEIITKVSIRETVPDSILTSATKIQLIDLSPDDLIKRLQEGKVYLPENAKIAEQNFFKEGPLTALRELALRFLAEKVDHELSNIKGTIVSDTPWHTSEKLLVAFSHSPYSQRLIRATRRLAYNLEAPWYAVYVNTGIILNEEDKRTLARNTTLARELGAEVITTSDDSLTQGIARIASSKNVTQIILGRPVEKWWQKLFAKTGFLPSLLKLSSETDVHVMRHLTRGKIQKNKDSHSSIFLSNGLAYWNVLWVTFAVSFFAGLISPLVGYKSIGFFFLLEVLVLSLSASLGPLIFAAALASFVWNFFFIPPRFTFAITDSADFMMVASFFLTATVGGFLTSKVKKRQEALRQEEKKTRILYEVTKQIATTENTEEKNLFEAVHTLGSALELKTYLVLSRENQLDFKTFITDEKEQAVAMWSFKNSKTAGAGTDTLPDAKGFYVPLIGNESGIGILALFPENSKNFLSFDTQTLVQTAARHIAMAAENSVLAEKSRSLKRIENSDKLHRALLDSVSHELRTPLTSVVGSVSALKSLLLQNKIAPSLELCETALEGAERLHNIVTNLLDLSRLSSGSAALYKTHFEVKDLISSVKEKFAKDFPDRNLNVEYLDIDVNLWADFKLLEHALYNILQNAGFYSTPKSEIQVRVQIKNKNLIISISDLGNGIPKNLHEKVFQKFFRISNSSQRNGTGLGLSIVKEIAEVHNGNVIIDENYAKGAKFDLFLPILENS